MSKLEFGNVDQIKQVKREAREAEQREEWDRVVAKSRQKIARGVREVRKVFSRDLCGELDCTHCIRSECFWHQDFADEAPNDVKGKRPNLDLDFWDSEVTISCLDYVREQIG